MRDGGKWFFESIVKEAFLQFTQCLKLVNKTPFARSNSLEHKGKFNRPRNMAMILYKELIFDVRNMSVKKLSHVQCK